MKGTAEELTETCGTVQLTAQIRRTGNDFSILITGGTAHIGAAGYISGSLRHSISFPGHRDKAVVDIFLDCLIPVLHGNAVVMAGIHYDRITKQQIQLVLEASCRLAAKTREAIKE